MNLRDLLHKSRKSTRDISPLSMGRSNLQMKISKVTLEKTLSYCVAPACFPFLALGHYWGCGGRYQPLLDGSIAHYVQYHVRILEMIEFNF